MPTARKTPEMATTNGAHVPGVEERTGSLAKRTGQRVALHAGSRSTPATEPTNARSGPASGLHGAPAAGPVAW